MRLQLIALAVLLAPGTAAADPEVALSGDTLFYSDDDHVVVVSPRAAARVALDRDGSEAGVHAVVDVVSAASVDVVSQATPGFTETRIELGAQGAYRTGAWLPGLALRYSQEPDYRSLGGRAGADLRLGGDTVASASYDASFDTVGRAGTAYADWSASLQTHTGELGLTQNLGRRTRVRAVATVAVQDGYLEKPYRHVPLFDMAGLQRAADDGVELGLDTFDDYRLPERPPEEVPDRRVRAALFARALRWFGTAGAGRADYRLYVDDWGMIAHTVELGLAVPLPAGVTAELRERAHLQSAVDFWERVYLVDGAAMIPRYRTIDRELSAYLASTTSAGATWRRGPLAAYGEAGLMYTRFDDFLLLDHRLAVIAQAGVRWTP